MKYNTNTPREIQTRWYINTQNMSNKNMPITQLYTALTVNFSPQQVAKAQMGSRDITLLFL